MLISGTKLEQRSEFNLETKKIAENPTDSSKPIPASILANKSPEKTSLKISNQCKRCKHIFSSSHGLKRHKRNVICKKVNESSKKFECKTCGKKLSTSISLERHMEVVECERTVALRNLKCFYCGLQCSSDRNLYSHTKFKCTEHPDRGINL